MRYDEFDKLDEFVGSQMTASQWHDSSPNRHLQPLCITPKQRSPAVTFASFFPQFLWKNSRLRSNFPPIIRSRGFSYLHPVLRQFYGLIAIRRYIYSTCRYQLRRIFYPFWYHRFELQKREKKNCDIIFRFVFRNMKTHRRECEYWTLASFSISFFFFVFLPKMLFS